MKVSGASIEQFTLPEDYQNSGSNYNGSPSLLVISDPDKMKVKYINNVVSFYCGIEADVFRKQELSFYKEVIHPADLSDYMLHLNSCKSLTDGEKKNII